MTQNLIARRNERIWPHAHLADASRRRRHLDEIDAVEPEILRANRRAARPHERADRSRDIGDATQTTVNCHLKWLEFIARRADDNGSRWILRQFARRPDFDTRRFDISHGRLCQTGHWQQTQKAGAKALAKPPAHFAKGHIQNIGSHARPNRHAPCFISSPLTAANQSTNQSTNQSANQSADEPNHPASGP